MSPASPTSPPGVALTATGLDAGVDGHLVVAGVSLAVEPGSLVAVVGENGSGKSTLLRALAGLSRPLAGRVAVDGADLHALPGRARARLLAWVGQEDAPAEELLVWQAVALGLVPHQRPWAGPGSGERETVAAALAQVGLQHLADRRCDHLSGGERRRVMLARGLAQRTGLVVLDEPTNHLDVAHQQELVGVLRGSGRTVIASLHDLDLARNGFDQAVVLHDGRALATGRAAEVLVPEVVRTAFGVVPALLRDPATGQEHLVLRPPHLSPADRKKSR
ncbi:iron complex transport system ATP-binding protein [Friedmanniella luteola]|uniref:Iron complex transport system ATP-binding protein n=1 Tax=Friedmanniella luteola TaxID=546871 RepID=A0A1H1TVH7_9ACTN|nr:ABC transporter ATP-binding protein [Friedmanniella luteola]SDS64192.1 iron complex transport system ATP-binding protein [Friedmanniella luteola]